MLMMPMEQEQRMEEEIEGLDQISRVSIYIDQLNNEDPNVKIHALGKLKSIAEVIGKYRKLKFKGPERSREELVPMLTEMIDKIDDNSELLLSLAEELGKLVK